MRRDIRVHGADDRHVVHEGSGLLEDLADLDPGLPPALKIERRPQRYRAVATTRQGFAVHLG